MLWELNNQTNPLICFLRHRHPDKQTSGEVKKCWSLGDESVKITRDVFIGPSMDEICCVHTYTLFEHNS